MLDVHRTDSPVCPSESKDGSLVNPGLVVCESFDQLGQCDEAERIHQQGDVRGGGLRLWPRPVSPVPRHGKRAEIGVAQAQCLDARDAADLQNDKPLSAQRMERVDDLSRSQRLIGFGCSSLGAWQRPAGAAARPASEYTVAGRAAGDTLLVKPGRAD